MNVLKSNGNASSGQLPIEEFEEIVKLRIFYFCDLDVVEPVLHSTPNTIYAIYPDYTKAFN